MKALIILLLSFNSFASVKPDRHLCKPNTTNISCRYELALICGEGYIDGCITQQTRVHRCILRDRGISCRRDIEISCPEHFRDGCETGLTRTHQCIPVRGPLCSSEESFECPEGFKDRCEMLPES